jgi:hypothetical protein
VIQTFNNAYSEVWELAARFLTPNEIAEIKKLVRLWRAGHREIALLPYVRFDDFAKARAGVEQQNPVVNGLFAQIAEANRSIQTATDFGERALFYTERMPRLLQWQTERTVQAVLDNPDLQRTLSTIDQVSKTVAEGVAKFDEQEIQAQKTLEELNQVTLNAKPLVIEARQTGETLTETFNAFDRLMRTLNPPLPPGETPKPAGKPFDIMEYGTVFDKATSMAHEARLFIDTSMQLESAPEFNHRIADIESFTQRRTDHITWRAAELIGFFFAMLFLYRWLCARFIGHRTPKKLSANNI